MSKIESSPAAESVVSDGEQTESRNESFPFTDTRVRDAPKNVSQRLWEKFKTLEQRTDEVSQKYKERRNKTVKKNKSIKVSEESQNEDGKQMKKEDINIYPPNNKTRVPEKVEASSSLKGNSSGNEEVKWEEVRGLIDVNKHLDPGITYSQTELEKAIDKAVQLGDIETAEELSDKLANRQFGKKISDAFQAREYLKRKKAEEESAKQKKSKKLHWGFQEKERWETKGNM